MSDFKQAGIHTCLWQLPYFTPKNTLFPEIIKEELNVKTPKVSKGKTRSLESDPLQGKVKWVIK